jgi:hypothetical protein
VLKRQRRWTSRTTSRAWAFCDRHFAHGLVLVLIGATIALADQVYPDDSDVARSSDDNFIDSVFSDPLVIAAASVAVVYVAAFCVISVLARIWNRQWLRRAGPFEISDEVKDLRNSVERWQQEAGRAKDQISELQERLADSNKLTSELSAALSKAGKGTKQTSASRASKPRARGK